MFNPKRDRVTLGERRAGMIVIVVTGGLGYFMILFFHLVYFSFPTLSFSERSPLIYFILFPFFSSRFHSEHIYSFDEDIRSIDEHLLLSSGEPQQRSQQQNEVTPSDVTMICFWW